MLGPLPHQGSRTRDTFQAQGAPPSSASKRYKRQPGGEGRIFRLRLNFIISSLSFVLFVNNYVWLFLSVSIVCFRTLVQLLDLLSSTLRFRACGSWLSRGAGTLPDWRPDERKSSHSSETRILAPVDAMRRAFCRCTHPYYGSMQCETRDQKSLGSP